MSKEVKGYPLFPPIMFIDVFFVLLLATIFVLVFTLGSGEVVGFVISAAVIVLFIGLIVAQSAIRLKSRYEILNRVVRCWDNLVFRMDDSIDCPKDVTNFINDRNFAGLVERTVLYKLGKHYQEVQKPLFITIKAVGTVGFNWRGVDYKVRGLQKGSWIEVEWRGFDTTKSLVQHEVAHRIIEQMNPNLSDSEHHSIMKSAGL